MSTGTGSSEVMEIERIPMRQKNARNRREHALLVPCKRKTPNSSSVGDKLGGVEVWWTKMDNERGLAVTGW